MGHFSRTWTLTKASWGVLRQDKELAVLPLLSALCTVGVALAFVAPLLLVGNDLSDGTGELDPGPMGYVLLGVGYLVVTYVGIYFKAALVSGAHQRLTGGDPTLGSSLGGATARFHRLAPWALLSATVGLVLSAIENQGSIGAVVSRLVGLAWRVVTFLVIPVLLVEDVGAVRGVRRSAELFKRTWGENLVAQFGFGLVGFLAAVPGVLVGGALVATGVETLIVVGIVAAVAWVALALVVVSALSGIFQAALYLHAAKGETAPEFAAADLDSLFRHRTATRRGL